MIPWELLDSAPLPGSDRELRLYQRDREFSIRMNGQEIMNSRAHGSEDALAELACARFRDRVRPRVLVGGLGLGFTVAAALRRIGPQGRVEVAELLPAVVRWNEELLGHLAGDPLKDPRVRVRLDDVVKIIQSERRAFDAILLDVDNGPRDMISQGNDRLYTPSGLAALQNALRPAGVLAVWSAGPDQAFIRHLEKAGFTVEEVRCRSRGDLGGRRHTIWLATARVRRSAAHGSGKSGASQREGSKPVSPAPGGRRRRKTGAG
jgi:spermidine synthase